jgi:hypothetical protein
MKSTKSTLPTLSGLLRQRLDSFPVALPVHHISATSVSLIIQNYVNHFLYGSVMSKHCNWWARLFLVHQQRNGLAFLQMFILLKAEKRSVPKFTNQEGHDQNRHNY